jgi:hypothetical protein
MEEKRAYQKAIKMHREFGVQFYKLPQGVARLSSPRPPSLAGTYEIIYQSVVAGNDERHDRTIGGTLILEESSEDRNGPPRLWGSVTFQPNLPDSCLPGFAKNFTFDLGLDTFHGSSPVYVVELYVILERRACRWMLREEDALDCSDFDSVEEAEALVEQCQKDSSFKESSVCNRLSPLFDASIAKRIHEYWFGWRPSPAFFLEPGDVCLLCLLLGAQRGKWYSKHGHLSLDYASSRIAPNRDLDACGGGYYLTRCPARSSTGSGELVYD